MQPRPRIWIPTIIGILILAFLVGFAPIRYEHAERFAVDSSFAFESEEPLYESPGEMSDLQEAIENALAEAGLGDVEINIQGDQLLVVETYAIDQNQADRDQVTVTRVLSEQFAALQPTSLVAEDTQEPVATFGPFGIYAPYPQLHLGLDLQGGAQVVLRCLSSAELSFVLGNDTPLVASEEPAAEGQQPAPFTEEQLTARIQRIMADLGTDPNTVEVSVVGRNRLIVDTRPQDQREVEAQEAAIHEFLLTSYPGVEVERGEISAVFVDEETADKVQYIIEQRLFSLGEIREPVIQKQGFDRIIVEMPGVREPERVLDILKSTALLEFRLVPEHYEPALTDSYDEWTDTRDNSTVTWEQVRAEASAEFTGRDLLPNASVQSGQTGDWVVAFELRPDQKDDFHEFTRRNIGRIMAIVLDRECQMAPVIRSAIPGSGIIEGNMTAQDASDLRLLLNAGALPVPLEIVENRTVSATLGQDSINRSLNAAGLGLAALVIFMIAYYRLPGVLAVIALTLYMAIVIAITAYSRVTLTLPGIAGIILSLGTAVDANVIIFERLKEELWSRKSMRSAVAAGFERAWTAILDGNVTTLIAAAVLYWLGTSLIKGFAIMLFIGVISHLFTAVTVTRWLLTMVAEARWAQNRKLYGVPERTEEERTQLA
ncbi:MAG: protein translocase subunit SecD [candidate division WS1 bacterium]|jgi:preprotein translocase subunit SecD|nr:protein translocase subunit SecD [candidate division WS1 bacterium]